MQNKRLEQCYSFALYSSSFITGEELLELPVARLAIWRVVGLFRGKTALFVYFWAKLCHSHIYTPFKDYVALRTFLCVIIGLLMTDYLRGVFFSFGI